MTSPQPFPSPLVMQEQDEIRRDTPLPRYEKRQSLPFTLNLQEDASHPGRFQLVVDVGSKDGIQGISATSQNVLQKSLPHKDGDSTSAITSLPNIDGNTVSSPTKDKQDWAELDGVPTEFLQQVVPDWKVAFTRSDSTVSSQGKKLADIKASIKKKGKGFVVRLLKGSSTGQDDVAEVDLGQSNPINDAPVRSNPELNDPNVPVELDSAQVMITADKNILGRNDICEIGSSNVPGVATRQRMPASTPESRFRSMHDTARNSIITEDGFSDAETLLPEVASISEHIEEFRSGMNRSVSGSSIVRTPTRGLSVVGVRRRNFRNRQRGSTINFDLNRSGARKSFKHSASRSLSSASPKPAADVRNLSIHALPSPSQQFEIGRDRPGFTRRASADDCCTPGKARSKAKLRLDTTNLNVPHSANVSPNVRRRGSPRYATVTRPSDTSSSSLDDDSTSPDDQATHSERLREALGKAFDPSQSSKNSVSQSTLPIIVEPSDDEHVGEIPLPSEVEIRSLPLHAQSTTIRYWGLALSALSSKIFEGSRLLQEHYGSERPVPYGHVRVRWTCSCGEPLYDDFVEQRPNAARLLEAYLNRPRARTPQSPHSRSSTSSSMQSIFDAPSRASTLTTPSSTYSSSSSWQRSDKQQKYSPTQIRSNNSFSVRMPANTEESWLLTCANEGKLTPKVVHLDVNEGRIRSDKDLALALREHHDQLNRRWYKWARLRGLTTIEYVQFEVHRNRFADIRAAPSMPPKSASAATTTPAPEKSASPSQHPYTFEPNDLLPPVGSTYLLHLFKHPNDYDGELITYLRSPKRRARLDFGMGWGVHLVEGFLAQRVWLLVMAICGLSSVVFAVMWTIKKDDVQGAFGVAQWVLGLAVLLTGAVQAWLE